MEKKLKENLWNKLFHKKTLTEQKQKYKKAKRIIGWKDQLFQDLNEAKNLTDIMLVHQHAWELGYQDIRLAPCEWGMFRTKNISEMKPEEVYLGNIWGLRTANIPFWEENKEETMAGNGFGIKDDTLIYDLIMKQYRDHLKSNFHAIIKENFNYLFSK